MSLRKKQSRFLHDVALLVLKAEEMGYEVTLGDGFRDARVFGGLGEKKGYGHPNSCHKLRLAVDLNLFKDGVYLSSTEAHKPLGEWWESIGNSWGGRFPGGDGNHYSVEHNGMR